MKPCDRVDSLLSAYLENETSPVETQFVKSHAAECVRCRRQLDEVSALLSRLADLPRVHVADDFTEKVLARASGLAPAGIDARIVELPTRRPAWVLPLAAAAAVTIGVWGVMEAQRNAAPGTQIAEINQQSAVQQERFAPVDQREMAGNVGTTETSPPKEVRLGEEKGESLGMARDAYILETYELLEPAGGGEPVLTRVGATQDNKVMVSF